MKTIIKHIKLYAQLALTHKCPDARCIRRPVSEPQMQTRHVFASWLILSTKLSATAQGPQECSEYATLVPVHFVSPRHACTLCSLECTKVMHNNDLDKISVAYIERCQRSSSKSHQARPVVAISRKMSAPASLDDTCLIRATSS